MHEKLYQLKQKFLEYWTLEKLQNMTLEQYTDTKRENSFCYWLEHITRDLGSIVGGSSYKFGIYKMGATSNTESATNRTNDGVYAWHTKYGENKNEAFETLKQLIINIATLAKEDNLNPIANIDLGDAYKCKIAFMYSDYKVVNLFKSEALKFIANSLFSNNSIPTEYGDLNYFILSHKEDEDYFEFTKKLWKHYDNYNSKEKEFKKWLDDYAEKGSNKSSSYLRAIKILINEFKIAVYTEEDINMLNDLYEDLKINQKDPNGKYSYHKKSYGEKGFYSAAVRTYIQFLKNEPIPIVSEGNEIYEKTIKENPKTTMSLNQILYGPPGTGKTYATKKLAVEIIDNAIHKNSKEDRKTIVNRYNELEAKGQIVFTTFHQSMSYEDFVEGIKPKTEDKKVTYEVEDGIFKKLANKAKGLKGEISSKSDPIDFKNKNYFKMSVGGKNRKDVHNWCIKNNYIAIGYGGKNDLSKLTNLNEKTFKETFQRDFSKEFERTSYSLTATAAFIDWLKKGDIVLISLGNHIIDAIGIVTGDYEYLEFDEVPYNHFRKVNWLATNLDADPSLFLDKNISQQTIYQFNNDDIKVDYLERAFNLKEEEILDTKEHVIIIDEINRGNVSAIFGELITLLEPDKRLGKNEEITVTLPYSKSESKFGIPSNLHIIGTMNTADRSVEALDTALRRRFEFKEIMPKPSLLELKIGGISLKELLETINKRIEILLDRDHTIGHSYFIKLKENDITGLRNAFKNNIIPLLQEYFYGDYEKIGLVLGKGFFNEETLSFDKEIFASFDTQNYPEKGKIFHLKTIDSDFDIIKAINILLKKTVVNE